jgi:hypothetical protein
MLSSHGGREDHELAALRLAAQQTQSESRDIIRQYEAARRDLHATLLRSRRLREESAALRAELEKQPGRWARGRDANRTAGAHECAGPRRC